MATVQMAANGVGGVIQGNFGTYQASSAGLVTADVRDAPSLLAMGMTYIYNKNQTYTTAKAPAAASAALVVASAALSNGAVTIAAQPDFVRPLAVVIGTGTGPVTAGTLSLSYTANDGSTTTDALSLVLGASGSNTQFTSKGVQKLLTGVVSGLAGGTSPFIFVGTTTALSVPVDVGAVNFSVYSEILDGAQVTTFGTVFTNTLGSYTPNTVPGTTHTYSFGYTYTTPTA